MTQLTIQQAFDLAMRHHQAGRLQEAGKLYRQILAKQPAHFDAMHLLGVLASQGGKSDEAVELIQRAVRLNPDFADAYFNLGKALANVGQLDEAIAAYRRAIQLKPGDAVAHNNLGVALRDKGQLDEAIVCHQKAIELKPVYAEAHSNLGLAFKDMGRIDQAVACYRKAIQIDPNYAGAHSNLGNALIDAGRLDEGLICHRQAVQLKPDLAEAHYNLGNSLAARGQLDEAIAAYRHAILVNPHFSQAYSNLLFTMHYHPAYNAQTIAEEHREWDRQYAGPLKKFIQPHPNSRNPDRHLRIGYVSPDFRDHPVGRNLLPLFQKHDHQQFEINCYAHVLCPDLMTDRLKQNADCWRNIVGLSDEQVAQQVREDGIDILVDLALHTKHNRLLVFGRKPAPVQVSYLGYPSTTGLSTMDYRLSDPNLDSPDTDLSCYSEKTLRLPRTYWCYQPIATPAPVPSPALKNGFVTFGCLNNFAKVSPAALDLWARILTSVPDSCLILHSHPGKHLDDVMHRLDHAGVANDRLLFVGKQPPMDYLQTYSRIDIALDPFPYGGGITTCDALWMGVPVITLSGQTAVGRGGRSILSNLGLTELIAFTQDQYAQIAIDLAKDRDRMNALRRGMRDRMLASPLMDAEGFARDMEAAYRQMWRSWCETTSAKS